MPGKVFTIGGQPRSGIAALDITTGLATAWNPGVAGSSNFVLISNFQGQAPSVLLGSFLLCRRFAATSGRSGSTTGVATAFNPGGLSGTVNVVKIFDAGSLFLGGGQGAGISKRDRTTGAALSWNALLNSSSVLCIAVDGSTVYVGGQFTSAGGSTRNRGAAFDGTTAALLAWDPSLNNYPRTFTLAGSKVLVGGEFTQGSLITRNRLAEVVASTSAVTSWNPNMDNTLWSLEANGTTVYAGGDFPRSTRHRVWR
ncbi:MAG: hypothetical protein IPH53_14655 [Flavobacteriales bacterium]|nr:hypothetical protein [Flavobacteriales bacterium]